VNRPVDRALKAAYDFIEAWSDTYAPPATDTPTLADLSYLRDKFYDAYRLAGERDCGMDDPPFRGSGNPCPCCRGTGKANTGGQRSTRGRLLRERLAAGRERERS
jgi:hypothetical protein